MGRRNSPFLKIPIKAYGLTCYFNTRIISKQENSEQQLYQWIADWLVRYYYTPLNQGFQLKQLLEDNTCLNVLSIWLYQIECWRCSVYSSCLRIWHRNARVEAKSARYLNGSIDLVYFDGQRYHIADYKSNYLGRSNWIISSLRLQKVCRCRVIGYKQRYILWHYIVICR